MTSNTVTAKSIPDFIVNDDNEPETIPTPEMALFPGITISTGSITSTTVTTNSSSSSDPNKNSFNHSSPIKNLQVSSSDQVIISSPSHSNHQENSNGLSTQTESNQSNNNQSHQSTSSTNVVHFKKALIYSSTTNSTKQSDTFYNNDNNSNDPNDSQISSSANVECDSGQLTSNKLHPGESKDMTINDNDNDHKNENEGKEDDAKMPLQSEMRNDDKDITMDSSSDISPVPNSMAGTTTTITTASTSSLLSSNMFNISPSLSSGQNPVIVATTTTPTPSIIHPMPQVITHVGRKPLNGPPCSLKTLVDDGILEPMDGSLTYEILGAKFFGDLLANGFIRMSGTNQVFANPSSWANYCRSTIPSTSKDHKNYGSAWSIIRYLGKRLDSYKLRWYRKQKKQFMGNGSSSNSGVGGNNNINSNTGALVAAASGGHTVLPTTPINICKSSNRSFGSCPATAQTLNGAQTLLATSFVNATMKYSMNNSNLTSITQSFPNHFSTPIQLSRANVEYKNIFSMINRDRLYKLDKISAGDPDINSEHFPDENIISFNSIDLNNKELNLDDRMKIPCVPFNSVYCLQPFIVTISTNVLLLIDFHSHLISTEVSGYLAGTWDPRTQHLTISQAYPMRFKSSKEAESYTHKIKLNMVQKNLILIGWYHSHPRSVPHPSINDIKRQLKYQKQMLIGKKGLHDYSPCIGLISSPFYQNGNSPKLPTMFQMFWVMPIFTMGNRNIGRPMQISYNIVRDAFLTQDLLVEMRVLAAHFATNNKFVKFNDKFHGDLTYWNKLQESLKTKLPRDLVETQSQAVQNDIQQQALMHFWSFLKNLLLIS